MMRVPEFLFEKVFEISFRQPEPFRATCGGKRAPYRPFSVGEVAVGKGFVLPDKGFVRRIPGDELPLVKAGRIIQQPDDMPGQNRARVAIRTVTEFPAQIVETKKRILFGPFLLYAALEQIGVECNRPQAEGRKSCICSVRMAADQCPAVVIVVLPAVFRPGFGNIRRHDQRIVSASDEGRERRTEIGSFADIETGKLQVAHRLFRIKTISASGTRWGCNP